MEDKPLNTKLTKLLRFWQWSLENYIDLNKISWLSVIVFNLISTSYEDLWLAMVLQLIA